MKMDDFFIILRVPFMLAAFCFILLVFSGITIWFWLKGDAITIRKIPIIFASSHFILATIFFIIVIFWTKYEEEAGIAWYIFSPLDWPVSIFLKNKKFWEIWQLLFNTPIMKDTPNLIFQNSSLFIYFSIFGTIQYYIWGLIISKILLFIKK